jgi:hypothetical protein
MSPAHLVLAALLLPAAAALAQPVKAPPLPPGSNLVRVEPGLNPEEKKRHVRAHHHKGHVKKDMTRDDSVGNGNAGNNGNKQGAKK